MTATRLEAAARRALESIDDLIANTTDPGVEALGARHELSVALIDGAVPSAPADRAAIYREVADELAGINFHPNAKSQNLELCRLLAGRFRRKADEVERVADEAPQPGKEASASEVVAYRDPNSPQTLLCRDHGERWQGVIPVTTEELPDGGICTFGRLSSLECGVDVLIPHQPAAVSQPGKEA